MPKLHSIKVKMLLLCVHFRVVLRAVVFPIGLLAVLGGCSEPTPKNPADTVMLNGEVLTVDNQLGQKEALAIVGHKIQAVGSNAEIEQLIGSQTQVIDLDGNTVIPGLIEGHGHFLGVGRAKQVIDLSKADTYQALLDAVAKAVDAAEPGAWIFGMGWHQDKWRSKPQYLVDGVPTNQSLSEISPDNPVLLGHASGHAAFANQRALGAAGISDDSLDPPGGTIVRDANGVATGLLRETAQRLVSAASHEYLASLGEAAQQQLFAEQVFLAAQEALSYGITSFHDAGASFATIDQFKRLEAQQGLPVRLYVMVRGEPFDQLQSKLADYLMPYQDNDFLTVRSIKRQIDGALGAHGAWLLEPYEDLKASTGLVLEPVADITRTAQIALQNGFQLNTHAIGTKANREVLNLYEKVWQEAQVNGADVRWRIEHAQHIHPDDVPRFGKLGVLASIQGVHCTSDGPWISSRLGTQRTQTTSYRWRDLIDSGARLNNGTDAPVESLNPFASMASSVTRLMANGAPFHPQQAMTAAEALYSYTMGNAYAAFEDNVKGSISPGKLADLVVINQNLLTIPPHQIANTQVLATWIAGQKAYQNPKDAEPAR